MKNKKKILAVALCAAALAVLVLGAVAFARREDEKSIADAGVAYWSWGQWPLPGGRMRNPLQTPAWR